MSTKAQLESNITAQLTGNAGLINAAEHEGYVKDDTHNILDEIYGDIQTDTEATESIMTLVTPGSATFSIKVCKQGRKVTLEGTVTAVSAITQIGDITPTDLAIETGGNYSTTGYVLLSDFIYVSVGDVSAKTRLQVGEILLPGETVRFSIEYLVQA